MAFTNLEFFVSNQHSCFNPAVHQPEFRLLEQQLHGARGFLHPGHLLGLPVVGGGDGLVVGHRDPVAAKSWTVSVIAIGHAAATGLTLHPSSLKASVRRPFRHLFVNITRGQNR